VAIKDEPDLEDYQFAYQEDEQESEPGSFPSTEQLNAEGKSESDAELPDWHRYIWQIIKKLKKF
jgi:hypothetical protein